jgi:NTP pyrophosphatase (non-canonical NTP hydrolase)
VKDPIKNKIVGGAIDCATGEGGVYNNLDGNVDMVAEEVGELFEAAELFSSSMGDVVVDEMGEVLDAAEFISSSTGDNLEEIVEFFVSFF